MNLLACKTLLLRPKPERETRGKKVKYIVAAICQKNLLDLLLLLQQQKQQQVADLSRI